MNATATIDCPSGSCGDATNQCWTLRGVWRTEPPTIRCAHPLSALSIVKLSMELDEGACCGGHTYGDGVPVAAGVMVESAGDAPPVATDARGLLDVVAAGDLGLHAASRSSRSISVADGARARRSPRRPRRG
jgi:hypothetical protein